MFVQTNRGGGGVWGGGHGRVKSTTKGEEDVKPYLKKEKKMRVFMSRVWRV